MDTVQDQYEHFPYPFRDPKDEDHRLVTGSPSARDEINHFLYGGARDWSKPFRVLIAGGGTGDALIMLAQQLADVGSPAEFVYLDISRASRAIAEARAARRGLSGITFVTGSLEQASELGPFDYIDCCGVLHHLPDPAAGFYALRGALKPGGGMGVMVYGELGRTGVYDAQQMLRWLIRDGDPAQDRIAIAKRLLAELPGSNRFKRNPFVHDHLSNDAGLYDLLLHARDRAYRVPEIYELLAGAGLEMVSFVAPANYDPATLVTDDALKERLAALSLPEQHAFAELLTGNLKKHTFYCALQGKAGPERVARFGADMIPVLHEAATAQLQPLLKEGKPITVGREGLKIKLALPSIAAEFFPLCDGNRTFETIRTDLKSPPPREAFLAQAYSIYRALNGINLMFLAKPR